MRLFGTEIHRLKLIGILLVIPIVVALVITSCVLTLAGVEYIFSILFSQLGFNFKIPDELRKNIVIVIGAIGVALMALYGVYLQNLSAEARHRIDKNLDLRKEIFMNVAGATAAQYEMLISYVDKNKTEAERNMIIAQNSKYFFQLQMVANKETVGAMLDANEEWTRALIDIQLLGPLGDNVDEVLPRFLQILRRCEPYMKKLWEFNILARDEIECGFQDKQEYLTMVTERFSHVFAVIEKLSSHSGLSTQGVSSPKAVV